MSAQITSTTPETFVARLPECLAIDFLRLSFNLIRLPSPRGPRYPCLRSCLSRRGHARGSSFANLRTLISERLKRLIWKDLISMTGTDDVKIIEGVIQSYLDGLYESDAGKISSVFHPTSALTSVTNDGELVITPRDSWLDKVRSRPSPKQQGLPRHDQV